MKLDGKYRNALARCQLFGFAAVDGLFAALLPWRCILCGARAAGMDLCVPCLDALPWLVADNSLAMVCGAGCVAALEYAPPVDDLITGLKFRRQRAAGRVLGELLAIRLQEDNWQSAHARPLPELLLPVPLHPRRLRTRGYNQADLIACAAGRELGVQVAGDSLRRCRATDAQMQLGRRDRLANPTDAFVAQSALAGKRVAVIDDVMTTGATLAACVTALRDAGVADVACWVVARTLLRGDRATNASLRQVSGSKV